MTDSRKWVAVIDDEADLATLFADALNSHGINAISFGNPLAAIDYLHNHHSEFVLIITDWRMPSMSGLGLAKLVQQIDPEIRILVMSAFELDKDELREINKSEYLRKPMHISQLIEAVSEQFIRPRIMAE